MRTETDKTRVTTKMTGVVATTQTAKTKVRTETDKTRVTTKMTGVAATTQTAKTKVRTETDKTRVITKMTGVAATTLTAKTKVRTETDNSRETTNVTGVATTTEASKTTTPTLHFGLDKSDYRRPAITVVLVITSFIIGISFGLCCIWFVFLRRPQRKNKVRPSFTQRKNKVRPSFTRPNPQDQLFKMLPHNNQTVVSLRKVRKFDIATCNTNRFKQSFINSAARRYNDLGSN